MSFMSFADIVTQSVADVVRIEAMPFGVRVATHCLYPGNSFVRVLVIGSKTTAVVSDEGRALSEAHAAGLEGLKSDTAIEKFLRPTGLKVQGGAIYSPEVPLEAISVAIALVANASRDVANWLYDSAKIKRERDFKKILSALLEMKFEKRLTHNTYIVGASLHSHKFDNVIRLTGDRRLIVDPVMRDMLSISARIVANLDVKETPNLEQRIVYDDEDDWEPADLNLLQVAGVPVVPFSKAPPVLERFVANA